MSVPPQGPPPGWPPQGPPYWAAPVPPPPSNNRGLLIVLSVIVSVCVAGFAGLMIAAADRAEVSDDERAANARVAHSPTDFEIVCRAGSVSNARSFERPHTIMAFADDDGLGAWTTITFTGDAPFLVGTDLTKVDTVACVSRKPGTEVKEGTCDVESGGELYEAGRYSVEYTVELRQARTGALVENLGTVPGPSDDCPYISFFDRESPKIFGSPDKAAVEAKLTEFVGE
ncbi:hypothetical protein [Mycobacterium sp. Root265]|uniref:hypothetical protein n=1 Tax=Mycobacterium sp. Root265 TaxID=1736504 RepID=UPI000AB029E9|nr:hypothetical protein [Mycobacterium sp. Root265]